MKTVLLLFIFGVLFLSCSSCKKDYTCTCNFMDSGKAQTVSYKIQSSTRSDAVNACDAKSYLLEAKQDVSCSIGK